MLKENTYYEEQPYAWRIHFEGEITIPVESEEAALMEVKKAVQKMCNPYEVWEDDNKNPDYGCWSDGTYVNLVEKTEVSNNE